MKLRSLFAAGSTIAFVLMTSADNFAQDSSETTTPIEKAGLGCDKTAIEWLKPGEFEVARSRAQKEKRLLIIKGISFGVDDAGAKCATKGMW